MRVMQINSLCGAGSTGRIAVDISNILQSQGHECLIAYGREPAKGKVARWRIGSNLGIYHHVLMTRITDRHGFYSSLATRALVRKIADYNPDIIHLHNIHGYYINVEILFAYLKKAGKPVVWTLHDCWAFTGHCAFFDYADCDRWQTGCFSCPEKKVYPQSFVFDHSKGNYKRKKELFTSLEHVVLVTPSKWLQGLAKQSFLKKYPVEVIQNGIELGVFKPTGSDFRDKHMLGGKVVLLGVANVWDRRKGMEYFVQLESMLDAKKYKIVLVGVSEKQKELLPPGILAFTRTNSAEELAQIYTASDVYVNTTLEDNFPTTNMESLACGTPVITFRTGGSPESIVESCGTVVEKGSIIQLYDAIVSYADRMADRDGCVEKAKFYDKTERYKEYIDLYIRLINKAL